MATDTPTEAENAYYEALDGVLNVIENLEATVEWAGGEDTFNSIFKGSDVVQAVAAAVRKKISGPVANYLSHSGVEVSDL